MPIKKKSSKPTNQQPVVTPVARLPPVISMLVYGRSGTGKTTFSSTFPKPLLVIDVREKGTDSIANVDGVFVTQANSLQDLINLYWYLNDNNEEGFKTVVIDHVTGMQDLALEQAKKDDGKEATDQASMRIFGNAGSLMKTWLMNYRELTEQGINVVFLAHDRLNKIDENGEGDDRIEPSIGAALMPGVASFLNGAVKAIGNTFIREVHGIQNKRRVTQIQYAMRVGAHAYYAAKIRSPVGFKVPAVLVDPDYDKVMAVMKGKYVEATTQTKGK